MDRNQAIQLLIRHSFLLDDSAKLILLSRFQDLSSAEIDQVGYLLALEKKLSLETASDRSGKYQVLAERLSRLTTPLPSAN